MILKLWSRDSANIRLLQTELNRLYPHVRPQLRVDGVFGQKTRAWVIKLQQSNRGLVVNGVFDPETQAELKKKLPDTKLVGGNLATAKTNALAKGNQIKSQNEIKAVSDKEGTNSSIPEAWGLKYEEVLSIAWLAYRGKGKKGKWNFPNAGSNWQITQVYTFGPFNAILIKGKKTVLAFAGTDDTLDWVANLQQGMLGFSAQYINALTLAKAVSPDLVVGHSLGGGLASYVAIYQGKPAATINPAALNINLFSTIQMLKNNHKVFNYVARGEILDLVDKLAPNMRRVGRIQYLPPGKSRTRLGKHSLENLVGFQTPRDTTNDATLERLEGDEGVEDRLRQLVVSG